MSTSPKRIALFDISGVFRQFWHATEHQEINEAYRRTIDFVHREANGFDGVGICCDHPPYIRKTLAPEYKAHRDKSPEALHEQMRAAIAKLGEDYHVFDAEGYEADDCIATIVEWALSTDAEVTVFSSDKDILSLVCDRVAVISAATRQKYGPAEVREKFGVSPDLIPDLLALAGDASDNIAGVPGCGLKTAAKWINELGGLEGVLRDVDKLPERFRSVVAEHRVAVGISWRLTQLMTDVPINPEEILMERKEAQPVEPAPQPAQLAEPEAVPAIPQAPTQAVVRQEPQAVAVGWERALEPQNHAQAWAVANMLYKSRMFGDFPTPESILAIIMTGRAYGLDAVTSLRGFHCIKNKICPSAQMMIGLVKRHPSCKYFRLVEKTGESATWETHRVGEPEPTTLTFTTEDAHQAGLLGNDNWKKRPGTMCMWRCGVELARAVYPDVVTGLYTPEEMREVDEARAA